MRVLVTTSPGLGHIFPVIGLTWALRAAGHSVLVATAGRDPGDIEAVVRAGLPVVETATVDQITATRKRLHEQRRREAEKRGITVEEMIRHNVDEARQAKHVTDGNGFAFALRIYVPMSQATADGLVDVARWWRPDLVLHESLQGGGPLVAAMLGIPAVEHPIGLSRGPEVVDGLREALAEDYRRHGVSGPPERTAAVDVSPPSMGIGPEYGWSMRYVQYSGGGVVGDWARAARGGRPRVAVTIGSMLPGQGLGLMEPIIRAAEKVDAEFVLTLGGAEPEALGTLPGNVTAHRYLPLNVLMSECDAVIHHGGAGSTQGALAAGLPQLVLPQVGDQFINAEAVRVRGCGLALEQQAPDVETLCELVGDPALGRAAREVAAEMAALPSPAGLVPRLVALAER